MTEQPSIPAHGPLRDALRKITSTLLAELREPTATPPDWTAFEWTIARAVCAMQGISGLLANRLRWQQPAGFLRFVREQREHTVAFRQRVRTTLADLDAAARAAGVPFIALKGSAMMDLELHGRGERPMTDIDLLVAPEHADAMSRVILALGYAFSHRSHRHVTFKPTRGGAPHILGEHEDNPLRIELHTHVAEELPLTEVDITASVRPAQMEPGSNPYASRTALLRHLAIHAAGNMRAHALRGNQAIDIAAFASTLDAREWSELLDTAIPAWWLYPPLALAARVRPGCIPDDVLARAARLCPGWLRMRARRYDVFEVSWSNPTIAAFPGIEWSRSPIEAARYARTRLIPTRSAATELRDGVQCSPLLLQLPWYQLSHSRRILRWILGRAPRVQTLTSVMSAMALERAART